MMQETMEMPGDSVTWDTGAGTGLYALLALVGTKRMDIGSLRERTRLSPSAFQNLVKWLQDESLVNVVSTLDVEGPKERAELTEKGEALLISMLERTCELPELR